MGARFGRYETLRAIASGGMATVHLARAVGAGGFERLVAIKVMHPGLSEDPEFSAMFLDEARVAARIRHPNVVGTLDVQDGPEGLFLVMEYIEGPTLANINRAMRKQGKRVPMGVGLRIVIDTLLGLHAAHEQTGATGEPLNIVHRDVSPQNILVGVDGLSKLTDFGVARAESRISSTRRGEVKGKLAYMSPQQVRTEPIDRRADVYAAGVVLWEALTGERLFRGDNDAALVLAVVKGPQRSPHDVDPTIPAAIDAVCMRALRTEPDERYPTALAFADALEEAAQQAGVQLATPRVIAAFVKELGAHKPVEVPPMVDEQSSPSERSRRDPPAPTPSEAPTAITAPEREPHSQVASVLSTAGSTPPRWISRGLWIAIAAVGLVGAGVVGARLFAGGSRPAAPATSASAVVAAPPPPEAAPATSVSAVVAAPPPTATASAAPVASTETAPKTHPAKAGTAATHHASARPRRPRAAKATPSRAPKGGSGWRPQGL